VDAAAPEGARPRAPSAAIKVAEEAEAAEQVGCAKQSASVAFLL
jgi:hypothetical protein